MAIVTVMRGLEIEGKLDFLPRCVLQLATFPFDLKLMEIVSVKYLNDLNDSCVRSAADRADRQRRLPLVFRERVWCDAVSISPTGGETARCL